MTAIEHMDACLREMNAGLATKASVYRVKLDQGGYVRANQPGAPKGRYFGTGANLYLVQLHDVLGDYVGEHFVRAPHASVLRRELRARFSFQAVL